MHIRATRNITFLLAVFCFIGIGFQTKAQSHEIGVFAGGAQFFGDVGRNDVHLPEKFAGSILYRYSFDHHFAWRFSLTHGQITAADSSSGLDYRINRNLEFWSEIYEASTTLEFNFFPYKVGDPKLHTFFIFGGFSVLHFNPRADLNGNRVELRPLSTEGQGTGLKPGSKQYSLYTFTIPFGFGYKFNIGRFIGIGAEVGFRRTWSDYIDDVSTVYVDATALSIEKGQVAGELSDRSLNNMDNAGYQRGNSKNNDWIIFSGITVTFKIFDTPQKCHDFSY